MPIHIIEFEQVNAGWEVLYIWLLVDNALMKVSKTCSKFIIKILNSDQTDWKNDGRLISKWEM